MSRIIQSCRLEAEVALTSHIPATTRSAALEAANVFGALCGGGGNGASATGFAGRALLRVVAAALRRGETFHDFGTSFALAAAEFVGRMR